MVEIAALIIIVITAPLWIPLGLVIIGFGLAIAAVIAVIGGIYYFAGVPGLIIAGIIGCIIWYFEDRATT